MASRHPPQLNSDDKRALLTLARATLTAAFNEDPGGPLRAFEWALPRHSATLKEPHPCFVTLMSMGIQLRGCIGTLETESPLYCNVHEFTLKAAFSDPRFSPVGRDELDNLHFEITVLGPTVEVTNIETVKIGKHGLVVEQGNHRGVLLAHVATEWGWDRMEFIRQTCEKAGLPATDWKNHKLYSFEEIAFNERDFEPLPQSP